MTESECAGFPFCHVTPGVFAIADRLLCDSEHLTGRMESPTIKRGSQPAPGIIE